MELFHPNHVNFSIHKFHEVLQQTKSPTIALDIIQNTNPLQIKKELQSYTNKHNKALKQSPAIITDPTPQKLFYSHPPKPPQALC